jgi:hypothetical protein
MTSRTRVRVDFNSRGAGGTVRASKRRADGQLTVGDIVEAYDPAEPDMTFDATVAEVDEESGRVLLDVHWEPRPAPQSLTFTGVRIVASAWTLRSAIAVPTIGSNHVGASGGVPLAG